MNPRAIDTTQRPFVLVWEVTQACELACKHCRADALPERDPRELTTEEGRALLADVRKFGENQLVVLSGGDPLIREDVFELVDYGTDLGLAVTMTPSGTSSLTDRRVETLADTGLRRLALSLDGSSAARHDGFRGEEGSFADTLAAAKAAQSVGLPLQVNTTVCRETVDDLPEVRDLVAELGAVLWSVFFLVPVGRGIQLDPITPPHAEQVMEWLGEVAQDAPFGVKTTEAPHFRRVVAQQRHTAANGGTPERHDSSTETTGRSSIGRRSGIVAGDGFAFVSHTGDVYPSGFLPESAGNVRGSNIVDVYRESPLFQRLRDRDALKGKCGACEFRNLCGGSRSRAFAYTGDPLESDPLCSYEPAGYEGPLPTEYDGLLLGD